MKTYIAPQTLVTRVMHHAIIMVSQLSIVNGDIEDEGAVLVKENRSNYNVWNDDWSQ